MDERMQQTMLDRVGVVMRRYHEVLERSCERALAEGKCGVLVVRFADSWLIGPHPSVPYGTIHEFPQGMTDETAASLDIDLLGSWEGGDRG